MTRWREPGSAVMYPAHQSPSQQMTTSPPRFLHATVALPLLALLALAGCDESLGPRGPEAGTYVLVSADGQSLPYTYYQDAQESLTLRADTLVLDGRGTARRATHIERRSGAESLMQPYRGTLQYHVEGESILLGTQSCNDTAICAPPEPGTLRDGEIELEWGWLGNAPRRYVRVGG